MCYTNSITLADIFVYHTDVPVTYTCLSLGMGRGYHALSPTDCHNHMGQFLCSLPQGTLLELYIVMCLLFQSNTKLQIHL